VDAGIGLVANKQPSYGFFPSLFLGGNIIKSYTGAKIVICGKFGEIWACNVSA